MRRTILLAVAAMTLLTTASAGAATPLQPGTVPVPLPEVGVVQATQGPEGKIVDMSCTPESKYDSNHANTYVDAQGVNHCVRLHISFGPIVAKPGQNDVLIEPVTVEKPQYDGYMVRFKPNLVGPGGTPPVEDIHLHHGTWLNEGRSYGSGPWIASGEEKTIVAHPNGYGLKIQQGDVWLFLHMVHNATAVPHVVWVTYDIDFVDAAFAESINPATGLPFIQNTRSIWLDVGSSKFSPGAQPYSFNPIYNSQAGFGSVDPDGYGKLANAADPNSVEPDLVCAFPRQNCANFNSANNVSDQQGNPVAGIAGWQFHITTDTLGGAQTGTLVLMGGHLHTGGIRDEVDLGRDFNGDGVVSADESRPIELSDAYYWNYNDESKVGAPPISWDFSMTGNTIDNGWAINLHAGDVITLNSVYDSTIASWYEDMGIVMTWLVPDKTIGYDVFRGCSYTGSGLTGCAVNIDTNIPQVNVDKGILPETAPGWVLPGEKFDAGGNPITCVQSETNLCVRGQITHPHDLAASNHVSCVGTCPPIPASSVAGPLVSSINFGGFNYGIADWSVIGTSGIPRVKAGQPVTFTNADTADYIWHTITRCAEPCSGATSASYPVPDGARADAAWASAHGQPFDASKDVMDFDSGELGYGLAPRNALQWTFTPPVDAVGRTFTFFCRIHPGMRGAFEVVDPSTTA